MYRYVFVVCGTEKHINTLNFSIKFLKHFSKYQIIVVTDSFRNDSEIKHDHIIDVKTPENFNHHQASIWLKTSLHKILPKGPLYCYLDSDIMALSNECDNVFKEYLAPITFASDHCPVNQFSPYAVNCNCLERTRKNREELQQLINKHNPYAVDENLMNNMSARDLYRFVNNLKKHPFKNIFKILQFIFLVYIIPGKKRIFHLSQNIKYDKSSKLWIDKQNRPILYHVLNYYKKIEKESKFRFKLYKTTWVNENNKNVYTPECNHLTEMISDKFKISINQKNWRHWNGGVFLFNESSDNFMETWHTYTNEIFKDKNWAIRDQGTLISTVWKYNLQDHKRIPVKFNFIADFNNPNYSYSKEKGFTSDNFETIVNPAFIHIFHEFGHKGWEIWDKVEEIKKTNSIH